MTILEKSKELVHKALETFGICSRCGRKLRKKIFHINELPYGPTCYKKMGGGK